MQKELERDAAIADCERDAAIADCERDATRKRLDGKLATRGG
jgi:hypothetical protein